MLIFNPDRSSDARFAAIAERLLPMGIPVVPFTSVPDLAALGLGPSDVESHLWWIAIDGHRSRDELAVARTLVAAREWWSPLAWFATVAPLRWLTALAYRAIAPTR